MLYERWPGRDEQARIAFDAAIRAGLLEEGHVFLARFEASRGHVDIAEDILRREVEFENAAACLDLGELLSEAGRNDEAESFLRRAVELGETVGHAYLAKLLAKDPIRRGEAQRHLRDAINAGNISDVGLEDIGSVVSGIAGGGAVETGGAEQV